jgi:hypothetical protein
VLWEFNRFLPEKPCQTGTLAKNDIIDFHHVAILSIICVILPPAPSLLQEDSSDALGLYTRQRPPRERLRSDGQAGSNPKVRVADNLPGTSPCPCERAALDTEAG